MTLQTTQISQIASRLMTNEIYWITTSYERRRNYIYEGVTDTSHSFFREGANIDSMRRIFVNNENLKIDGKDVIIIDDMYKLDVIGKDENPEEYSKLEKLWRSKNAK